MQRILVIGCGGAGKSTVARRLADRLGLPIVHLDRVYWRAGWTPTPEDEWRAVVAELIAKPRWVMDGNYGGTMAMRLSAADTVIFLDLPRVVCLWRVVKRRVMYHGRSRPDIAPGCAEQLNLEFLSWILWTFPNRHRQRNLERLKQGGARVIILTSQRQVDRFLDDLASLRSPSQSTADHE
jgi:adenylate kinase family enzyme